MVEEVKDLSEQVLADVATRLDRDIRILLRPSKLIVPRSMFRKAMRILFYRPPIRKVKGMRARKRALYWRGK